MITIQYLEPNAETTAVSPQKACTKLQDAFDRLPIDVVLLGWSLPESVITAVREVTHANQAKLYRWQPLLTGDGTFMPQPAWQTVGVRGERVPGFRGLPEFTFVCPNKTAVRDQIFAHVQSLCRSGIYDGIFLDRMRFPSPAADPGRWLACFCEACQQEAAKVDLDLTAVRHELAQIMSEQGGFQLMLAALLGKQAAGKTQLQRFLDFRTATITQFITETAAVIRQEGLAVGLDCFAPSLTPMVGQDLAALSKIGDWVKVMTYAHTRGPAGLPFELLELLQWLMKHGTEAEVALNWLSDMLQLPLPVSLAELRNPGLSATALQTEILHGKTAVHAPLLAGIELIKLEGVTHLGPTQIKEDLTALKAIQTDGLALSWDLWHMPLSHLELVAGHFVKSP